MFDYLFSADKFLHKLFYFFNDSVTEKKKFTRRYLIDEFLCNSLVQPLTKKFLVKKYKEKE